MTAAKVRAVEAIEAEVDSDGTVEVPLGDTTVRVRPASQWRSSATRALREGDYDSWAEACLIGDDYDVWCDLDPTMGEVEKFFDAWETAGGSDLGKRSTSRRSARSTARR